MSSKPIEELFLALARAATTADEIALLKDMDDEDVVELFRTGVWLADLCGTEAVVRNSIFEITARRSELSKKG